MESDLKVDPWPTQASLRLYLEEDPEALRMRKRIYSTVTTEFRTKNKIRDFSIRILSHARLQ